MVSEIEAQLRKIQITLETTPFEVAKALYDKTVEKARIIDEHVRPSHKNATKLAEAVKLVQISPNVWQVYIDETLAPHARYVILGTSKMPSRDFLTEALEETRKEFNL